MLNVGNQITLASHWLIANLDWRVAMIVYACLLIIGIALGLSSKIVIFRNYSDLALCLALPAVPLFLILILMLIFATAQLKISLIIIPLLAAVAIFAIIAFRTYQDNGGVFSGSLALLTKIPLGLLYILALIDLIAPTGNSIQRAAKRNRSLVTLILLTPVLYGLIKDKNRAPFFLAHRRDR